MKRGFLNRRANGCHIACACPGRSDPESGGVGFLYEERGSNLVEAAMVLPAYFLFIIGLFSFSIVLFAYANASFASAAAARYAAMHSATSLLPCTSSTVQNLVIPYLWGAPSSGAVVSTSWTPSNSIGSTVLVNVKMTYTTGLPYAGLKGLVVSASAQEIIIH